MLRRIEVRLAYGERNDVTPLRTQLARAPLPLPKLAIKRRPGTLFEYRFEDFEIGGYQSHPAIKAPIAV